MVQDYQEPEDITQEVFIQIYQSVASFRATPNYQPGYTGLQLQNLLNGNANAMRKNGLPSLRPGWDWNTKL